MFRRWFRRRRRRHTIRSLEPAPAFAKRKYCDYSCRSRATMAARATLKEPAPSEAPTLTDTAYGGPPAPVEVAEELLTVAAPERPKAPALNRPVRPVKLPSTTPPQRPPIPLPSLQAKPPDPRPQVTPYTVTEGEVIERADFGTCSNEGCGERLNAFGKCRNCEQRAQWLKGQRARLGTA